MQADHNPLDNIHRLPEHVVAAFAAWGIFEFLKPKVVQILYDIGMENDAYKIDEERRYGHLGYLANEVAIPISDKLIELRQQYPDPIIGYQENLLFRIAFRSVGFLAQATSAAMDNLNEPTLIPTFFERAVMITTPIPQTRQLMLTKLETLCKAENIDLYAVLSRQ